MKKELRAAALVAVCLSPITAMADNAAQVALMDSLLLRMHDALAAQDVDAVHGVMNDMDSYKPGMRKSASSTCFAAYDALGWVLSDQVVQADMDPEDAPLPEYAGHKQDFEKKRLACAAGV